MIAGHSVPLTLNTGTQDKDINTDIPFIAPQLSTLTKLVFTLPRGVQTDLLKQSDQSVMTHCVCILFSFIIYQQHNGRLELSALPTPARQEN